MVNHCATCEKKVKLFSVSSISGKYFCNETCKHKFKINKEKDKKMETEGMIKEIKCKCNKCKHIWHFLESDKKRIRSQARNNACMGAAMCCNPLGALFSNKSIDLQREIEKMKKCPKCNSANITKNATYHKRK